MIWFIDNLAALTAMLKGSSPVQDSSVMALVLSMQLAMHRVSAWFEFVDTQANPSYPLSRGRYDDKEVLEHLASGAWRIAYVPKVNWSSLLRADEVRLWLHSTALGGTDT